MTCAGNAAVFATWPKPEHKMAEAFILTHHNYVVACFHDQSRRARHIKGYWIVFLTRHLCLRVQTVIMMIQTQKLVVEQLSYIWYERLGLINRVNSVVLRLTVENDVVTSEKGKDTV